MKSVKRKLVLTSFFLFLGSQQSFANEEVCGNIKLQSGQLEICGKVLKKTDSWVKYNIKSNRIKAGYIIAFRQINAARVCKALGHSGSVFMSETFRKSYVATSISGLQSGETWATQTSDGRQDAIRINPVADMIINTIKCKKNDQQID